MIETKPNQSLIRSAAVVSIVAALGVVLALQGWRSRVPGTDVIPYIDGAQALLSHGRLPDHGVVTSFSSYAPPGFAWLVLPGVYGFSDPRVFDVPGNAILHLGTLFGIFLLARACFGSRCALLSVLLYGVSEPGLTFANSFGPRGHPFFYVWMAYWTCWWVARRDARYLAAALVTWLAGMYAFMEIAPALFILPVVWVFYRPRVRLRALAVAGALGLLMWYPYLRFEATRGFADLRSQVLLQSIAPEHYTDTFCDSTLTLRRWDGRSAAPVTARMPQPSSRTGRFVMASGRRVLAITRGLVVNFEGLVPGIELVLLALTVTGLLVLSVGQLSAATGERDRLARSGGGERWPIVLAIGLLVASGLANEVVIGRALGPGLRLPPYAVSAIRTVQAMAALCGIALLMRRSIARCLKPLTVRSSSTPCDPRILVIALVVPWLVLLSIAEWGRQDRFGFLWPLQVIVMAFASSTLAARLAGATRLVRWSGPLLMTGAILANPFLLSRVDAWLHDGWSGADAVEIQVADHLARQLRSEGRDRAAIGRRLFVEGPPEPPWKAVDSRWRVGGELDIALEYRNGIANLNTCAEGVSPQDEYRIVEAYPPAPETPYDFYYFDVPPTGRLRLFDRVGPYELYKTDRSR
jgi:hypothetical protein